MQFSSEQGSSGFGSPTTKATNGMSAPPSHRQPYHQPINQQPHDGQAALRVPEADPGEALPDTKAHEP